MNNGIEASFCPISNFLKNDSRVLLSFPDRYVSRVNYLDSSKHTILGTQQFRPKEFSTQIALNMDNAWGILRCIIDTCMKLPDGKYLILKDPLKVSLLSGAAP